IGAGTAPPTAASGTSHRRGSIRTANPSALGRACRGPPLVAATPPADRIPPVSLPGPHPMANTLVQDLIEAGIHFGQRASSWNPKMQRFIYGKRNGIHIIDIKETVKGLLLAKKYIAKSVAEGKDVCFVGTKRQAKSVVEQRVGDVGMHFVI